MNTILGVAYKLIAIDNDIDYNSGCVKSAYCR